MPDFSVLNSKPVGQAKKPVYLQPGDYMGVIKGHEVTENTYLKPPQPIIRLQLGLLDWPESVEQDDRMQEGQPIDLAKRQLRRDYRFNAAAPGVEDDLWRLDELIKELGINGEGRSYLEVLPELHGQRVLVEVQIYTNKTTMEIGNQAGKVKALV